MSPKHRQRVTLCDLFKLSIGVPGVPGLARWGGRSPNLTQESAEGRNTAFLMEPSVFQERALCLQRAQ